MSAKAAPKTARRAVHRFYEESLSEAERAGFAAALEVQGIDEEIALLRLRLGEALKTGTPQFRVVLKAIDMLARAVVARFKLGPGSEEQLRANLRRVLADTMDLEEGDGN